MVHACPRHFIQSVTKRHRTSRSVDYLFEVYDAREFPFEFENRKSEKILPGFFRKRSTVRMYLSRRVNIVNDGAFKCPQKKKNRKTK